MQIVSAGNNLHEISSPVNWKNKKNINLSPAEFAQTVVTVNIFLVDFNDEGFALTLSTLSF